MKNSPIIGLAPLWDDGKQCVWMEQDYLEAITLAGGMPIILPLVQNDTISIRTFIMKKLLIYVGKCVILGIDLS